MNGYESMVQDVTRCLGEDSHNEARIIEKLNHIQRKEGDKLYQAILYVLTHLEYSEKEAKNHWGKIMQHSTQMGTALGREVGLRVAICAYFFNINRELENPIIIEIEVYQNAEKLSNIDSLTGLFNRRYFETALDRELSRARRFNTYLSLLFLDIDDFKHYNDSYGHVAGDKALKSVAQVILKSKRMIDVACRYGGEEFVLILPNTSKSGALVMAERLHKQVEMLRPVPKASTNLKEAITITGGLSTFPQDANNREDLILKADEALYKGKQAGKNRIDLYSTEKRRFVRADVDIPSYYKVIEPDNPTSGETKIINLCETGLICEMEKIIPVASTMVIELKLPRVREVLSLLRVVVHVRRIKQGKARYLVGLHFIRLKKEASHALLRYIRRVLSVASNTTP
jgi:diguanylate cyclase (GGDEF)-like protein